MNARRAAMSCDMSSSAQCGTNSPVSALMITVDESPPSESAMVSGVTKPATVAPGMKVMTVAEGENPSLWLKLSVDGSYPVLGIIDALNANRRPVLVLESSSENTLLG